MDHLFHKRLVTPNEINEEATLAIGYSLAFLISFADYMTSSTIQLHFLYVFPIAIVGLHADKNRFLFGILGYSNLLQLLTITSYENVDSLNKVILIVLCLFITSLTAYFSKAARIAYLEAKNSGTSKITE